MVNYLTEAELKFQYLFCHKMAPWVALRQEGGFWRPKWILLLSVFHRQGQLGHSRGLGTAASIVGAARWRISPPSEIQRFLIWMQSLMPNPWGKYDMMKSFSREKNIWRLFQGPILHVLIARSWFSSHRSPLYKLAAQRSKIFFLWFFGGVIT